MAELDDLLEAPKQLKDSSLSSFPSLGRISIFAVDSFTTIDGSLPQRNALISNSSEIKLVFYGKLTIANDVLHSKPQAELKVTVGALSLITPHPEEQVITILEIVKFYAYDPTISTKHDIALIEVCNSHNNASLNLNFRL